MLSTLLKCNLRVERVLEAGRTRLECYLVDDGVEKLIWLYEGQLKEIDTEVVPGRHYEATFLPVINNRWVELRLTGMTEIPAPTS